jgi:hypothetical protein
VVVVIGCIVPARLHRGAAVVVVVVVLVLVVVVVLLLVVVVVVITDIVPAKLQLSADMVPAKSQFGIHGTSSAAIASRSQLPLIPE